MITPPQQSKKLANFSTTSSLSGDVRRGSKKIDLNDMDSRSRNSCYSFYQDQSAAPSVCSPPSVASSCSFFRVNIGESSAASQSSSTKKANPYGGFNRSEIYKYPNLVKLNLDFYFTRKKGNRTKYKDDDKYSNVFSEFELNNDFNQSHFSSEEEIQKFYADKLNELQKLQEEEIDKFVKKWEKEQVDATVSDFQDFCFLQGTKIILRDCGNETLAQRPSRPEETVNLRKVNEKNEKLFELLSLRHEKEAKLLVLDFQDQLRKFRERCIDSFITSEYQIIFEDNEESQISHISNPSDISSISGIKKGKNKQSNDNKKDIDAKISVDDDSDINLNEFRVNFEDHDSDWALKNKRQRNSLEPIRSRNQKFENYSNDNSNNLDSNTDYSQIRRTPPSNQQKLLEINFRNSQSQKTMKQVYQTNKRDCSYRPRFNNYV